MIDPSQDLQKWNQRLQTNPNDASAYIRRGMAHFKLGQIEASIQDFDQAEHLDPRLTPYLWQRGLSFYYADRFEAGARQFEVDLTVNAQDVEETVWRYLCIARLQGSSSAQKSLLVVKNDPRPVMRQVYQLYAGNCTPEAVLTVGVNQGSQGEFYSNLYVGLYYEAAAEIEQARSHLIKAAQLFQTQYRTDDYMGHLALVHQNLRGWTPDLD